MISNSDVGNSVFLFFWWTVNCCMIAIANFAGMYIEDTSRSMTFIPFAIAIIVVSRVFLTFFLNLDFSYCPCLLFHFDYFAYSVDFA